MRISVVLPVLDEERLIRSCLSELAGGGFDEILVVDGGSADATVELARSFEGVRVIEAPRGRGVQMNAGAAAATGDVLLFAHADLVLPAGAARQIRLALADPEVLGGAFRTWTVWPASGPLASALLHLADLRSRIARAPYGDQAIFVRTASFKELGGYAPIPLMEDLDFSRRLRARGRLVRLPGSVVVSGRRWARAPVRTTLADWLLPALWRAGVRPERLARWYGPVR